LRFVPPATPVLKDMPTPARLALSLKMVRLSALTVKLAFSVHKGVHFRPSALVGIFRMPELNNVQYAQQVISAQKQLRSLPRVPEAHTLIKDNQLVHHAQPANFVLKGPMFLSPVLKVLTLPPDSSNVKLALPATPVLRVLQFQCNVLGEPTLKKA
jgi:hypothetical protein